MPKNAQNPSQVGQNQTAIEMMIRRQRRKVKTDPVRDLKEKSFVKITIFTEFGALDCRMESVSLSKKSREISETCWNQQVKEIKNEAGSLKLDLQNPVRKT